MPSLHIHIGHHFFGAGNLGDDLMLAGFLQAVPRAWLEDTRLTCCCPHDVRTQQRRYPEIEWLPYDPAHRADCIRQCDAWLGLGGTPFQASGTNTWMLDHLCDETAWCRHEGAPMYYLGVGVNEAATASYPQMRVLVGQAERLWMRDDTSLALLAPLTAPGQATAHADLAHAALAQMRFPAPEPDVLGLVLNFEDPSQFSGDDLAALIQTADGWQVRWLAQEVRSLPRSEIPLHMRLPAAVRQRAPLRIPDYGAATSRDLLTGWEGVGALFASRYHAAVIGAWMGARVAVFARNDKVAGVARQLGLPVVTEMSDTAAILRTVQGAAPVEPARLQELAETARAACQEFVAAVRPRQAKRALPPPAAAAAAAGEPGVEPASQSPRPQPMPPSPPQRILFLRPDAYGDLFLFEPVPRLVRHLWPQVEIGVLIRQPCADAVSLLEWDGIRILTTDCNPYVQSPEDSRAALETLRGTIEAFAPDCVVAACAAQTWLEPAVASFLPGARQISLGEGLTDPLIRAALAREVPVDWSSIFPEKVPVEPELPEWERNIRLTGALLGQETPRWWPVARVPDFAAERAGKILAERKLPAGEFVVCAAAGSANVKIKSWPANDYGETLAWLERERGIRALLIGHAAERQHLESVREAARAHGGDPALWLGEDGEMPVVAGLLSAARFYFGNDTGALHLAASLGRPVAAVFGGGTWPRFVPMAHRSLSVVQPLPCFGCGWDCYFVDAPCVRTISPAAVQRALEQFLQDDKEGQIILEAEGLEAGARALIDNATPKLKFLRADSADRLLQIRRLGAELASSEVARHARMNLIALLSSRLQVSEDAQVARQREIEELHRGLQLSEDDRTARLKSIEEMSARLQASEKGWSTHADQIEELGARLQASEDDRTARLEQIEELSARLQTSETDRTARLEQIDELSARLQESEFDRDTRLQQIADLSKRLETSEADRTARLEQINEFSARLQASEDDRTIRLDQIEELSARLQASEEDRTGRLKQIEELGISLQTSEADRTARLEQIEELSTRLQASEEDRTIRLDQIEELSARLQASEEDRTIRLDQIEELSARLQASEEDRSGRLDKIEELSTRLQASEEDRSGRLDKIEELSTRLQASEADRTARLDQIEELSTRLRASEEDRSGRLDKIEELSARLQACEEDRTARLDQIDELSARLQASEDDGTGRLKQIEELGVRLQTSEEDRTARLEQIEELNARLQASEEDRSGRLDRIEELGTRLLASEEDRAERLRRIEELNARLQASEDDRTGRLKQIEELGVRLQTSEEDRTARLEQIEELNARLQASEEDRDGRLRQIEEVSTRLQASEADRTARWGQIEELNARLQASEADRATRLEQIGQLTAWLETSEADRAARLEQVEHLTALLQGGDADGAAQDVPIKESTNEREALPAGART